jgi:hypothetical protein
MVEQERYKALEESSQEEIDELAVQLTDAQEKIAQMEGQLAEAPKKVGGAGGGGGGGRGGDQNPNLKEENVMQLVTKQMELAQLSETEMMLRRDLSRAKEVNVKLAAKLTELEAKARR